MRGQSQQPDPGTWLTRPAQYTEEQFFEAGRFLARIEHRMQWPIGDWDNAIPDGYGDKKAACEKAGLDFSRAAICGWVASAFKPLSRDKTLSFKHHYFLAVDELTDEQRTSLLRLAQWGEEGKDGKRKPWAASRLAQERDKVLGRERIPLPDFDEKVNKAIDSLPKNTSEKIRTLVRHLLEELKARFQREVEGEVKKRMAAEPSESPEDEKRN